MPIGGYDPTREPYGDEMPSTVPPNLAQAGPPPPDGKPLLSPQGNDRDKIIQALKMIVPAIAAAYSMKQGGGLGGFMQGFGHGEEQNNLQQDRLARRAQDAEETKFQRDREQRIIAGQLQQQAHQERQEAAAAEAKAQALQVAKAERERAAVVHAFDMAVRGNPGFMKKMNQEYREGKASTMSVPGVGTGTIDVKEAFDNIMGGMHDSAGDMLYGDEELAPTKPSLTTGVDVKGNPIRVEDKPGVVPFVRPRAPQQPPDTKRRISVQKLPLDPSDPRGPQGTFRIDLDTGENLGEVKTGTAAPSGTIRARDPQGKLHEASAGTALPAGWKLEP